MELIPHSTELLGLVKQARQGELALPQFQRNFVWERDRVADLLRSVMQGYFIGTFLLLRCDPGDLPFAVRPLEGVHPSNGLRPTRLVLDGQQRLTSLHYVFTAPDIPLRWTKYPYRFYLDLKKAAAGNWDEAILSWRADEAERYYGDREAQFRDAVVPFTVSGDWSIWDDWLDAYQDWARAQGTEEEFREQRKVWKAIVQRLLQFKVPVIELPHVRSQDKDGLAQVCVIFEKMNSTGVPLSTYDLLTARMYRFGIDMHALWEETMERYDHLKLLSEGKPDTYGYFLLRSIALLRNQDVKSRSLINLDPKEFERDWWRAVEGMEEAIQRWMSTGPSGFGAFQPKWIPYATMISPLAAFLVQIHEHKDWSKERSYHLLRRWYWASVFTERYGVAVDSTIYRDYQDLMRAMAEPDFVPLAIQNAEQEVLNNPKFNLRSVSRVNAIYRGVMCLVALRGALDFQANDSIAFHDLDDHHIFPKGAFKHLEGEFTKEEINSVVNRTLISAETNRRIGGQLPSRYVPRLVPEARRKEIFDSHFITGPAVDALLRDDFAAFLEAREEALIEEVRRRVRDISATLQAH